MVSRRAQSRDEASEPEPRPADGHLKAAPMSATEPSPFSFDPRHTPRATAIVPDALMSDREPTSREILLDERVDRLLKENYELLKERKELREIAGHRYDRCSELLEEARLAKRLVRESIASEKNLAELMSSGRASGYEEIEKARIDWIGKRDALTGWAAKSL